MTGADIREWVELLSKKGADIILFHNWRPPLHGPEVGGFGLKKPDGTATERLVAVKEVIEEFRKLTVESGESKIGIYYSRSSDMETFQEEGPGRGNPPNWFCGRADLGMFFGNNSIVGAYKILYRENIAPDFVFEQDLDKLSQYKVLLLTNPYLLDINEASKIRSFVEKGGVLISDSRFGLKDGHSNLYQKPLLEDFLGVEHLYTEIIENCMNIANSESKAFGFRDIIKPKDAVVLFSYDDKHPAVIEKNIGRGLVIYSTFSMFSSFLKSENIDLAAALRKIFKK